MPPKTKQVYGKRANTTASSYVKFVSPDKDDFLRRRALKCNDVAADLPKDVCLVQDVELQLEALTLHEKTYGKETPKATRGRPRKSSKKKDGRARTGLQDDADKDRTVGRNVTTDTANCIGTATTETQHSDVHVPPGKIETSELAQAGTTPKKTPSRVRATNTAELVTPSVPNRTVAVRTANARPAPTAKSATPAQKTQLPSPESSPEPDSIYFPYVSPLLELCDRKEIVPFEQWSSSLDPHFEVTKIAEASFSEVYRLSMRAAAPDCAHESVIKMVALRTPPNAPLPSELNPRSRGRGKAHASDVLKRELAEREENDLWKSQVEDVHSEVKLVQNLNHIPGFTTFRELTVLQGRPSSSFGQAWKSWNKTKPQAKKSHFPDPTKKASYEENQLWVVIEMQDAGTDVEKVMNAGGMSNIWEVWDVFWGVCLSVAKAEEACNFEHRDLHLENICIRSAQPDVSLTNRTIQNPLQRKLGFTGLETTVIDYTLSRADMVDVPDYNDTRRSSSSSSASLFTSSSARSSHRTSSGVEVAYLDLNKDMALFTGDAELEYQYEIYRYMRSAVYYGNPLRQDEGALQAPEDNEQLAHPETPGRSSVKHEPNGPEPLRRSPRKHRATMATRCDAPTDIWKRFYPKTNLLWAHFILYKLMLNLEGREPENLSMRMLMKNVEAGKREAKSVQKKAIRLHKILRKVDALVDPARLGKKDSLGSVKELVVMAMERGWLGVEDVVGGVVS